jgi:type II secretory pathway predicted ATPase ExeA
MTLKDALVKGRVSYRELEKDTKLSLASLSRLINHGEYPARRDRSDVHATILAALTKRGLSTNLVEFPQLDPRQQSSEEHHSEEHQPSITREEINLMQFDRNVLSLFGLRTNPFLNDIETDDDVYPYKGHDQVVQAIREAIEQRGFLAVTAPSGAGKTTIWDGIEGEFGPMPNVVICKPQLKAKEKLSPEHLCRALLYGMSGDDCKIHRDSEDRGRQLSRVLRALRDGVNDRKAVLYIDDAHFCSASVLRQLKTFFEEKVGRARLLAIVLVGLPQLKTKLAAFAEIGNRIRVVDVPPVPVKDYLNFKLQRIGSGVDKVFDPAGLVAFLERFKQPKGQPQGYPLIINATCIRAMVRCYENGAAQGERITREIIDQLPGGTAIQVKRIA